MHNNYHFLCHLIPKLKEHLLQLELVQSFSQNKDELVLMFEGSEKNFNIKASLDSAFSCLTFPKEFHRAKKNSVDLFKELIGLKVEDVLVTLNDRSFIITFEKNQHLVFQLYGRRGNIHLVKGNIVSHTFRSLQNTPEIIDIANLDRVIDQSYDSFVSSNGDVKALFPTFGPVVLDWLNQNEFAEVNIDEQWNLVCAVLDKLSEGTFFISEINEKLVLSLLPIGNIRESFTDPLTAINFFANTFQKESGLAGSKKQLIDQTRKSISKIEKYLKTSGSRLDQLLNETPNNQIADIIMANLHQINAGQTSVELLNFYSGKMITIGLKKDLSPQKNAENYYRKSKNQDVELQQLKNTIQAKQKELEELKIKLVTIENTESIKELKAFDKSVEEKRGGKEDLFKVFDIDGFKILVGRNSKNNDLLTQQYAHKDDLWLHAKDVSGSHVVIKYNSSRSFSRYVKEQAAAIAAYYSKRKTDSLCPVICTPKKFVRKPKGSLPGQVVVDKEEVILVEPGLPT